MRSLVLNLLIGSALTVALVAVHGTGAGALAQGPVVVGVDVDTTGNQADSLGEPQYCRSVSPGDRLEIDVFLDKIPEGRNLAGFSYALGYDSGRASIQAKDHMLLLVANRDTSGVADLSEDVPDSDGLYRAAAADLSPTGAQPGPLAGVLGRYTIEVAAAAPSGIFPLTLTMVNMVDGATEQIPVDEVHNGKIAVGQACSQADQSPDIVRTTPEPTDRPAATGGATATPATGTSPTQPPGGATGGPASPTPPGETAGGEEDEVAGSEDDDGGFPWIAAVVSVLVGLAILGGGGALIWRQRRSDTGL